MGRATVLYLAKQGYFVYAGSRTPEKLFDMRSENIYPLKLDITDPQSIEDAIPKIKTIDILINNAGYGLVSTVEEVTEEEMFAQFNVNVFGVMRMCKAVIPKMRKQKSGVIINISSFLGKIGLPLLTFYNASKYAVEGVTDSLRYELRDYHIRVHSIMPGFFDTNFARDNLVTNKTTFSADSPYVSIVSTLAPMLIEQINSGNSTDEVAKLILGIIENKDSLARQTAGDKAKKFIPMKKELSDEDFERRVRAYYDL
ncbi:Oxidoreductase, short chain dehydrogenase/reductase family [hydrothermal vent metagenome]|uniref:Oxidoreductase, short chain dehydrogenase/reductase family n=1 Tax=hydrothermal vent metagenome TaxID=652676 RepID=A0A1W1BXM4_9ZZZZ